MDGWVLQDLQKCGLCCMVWKVSQAVANKYWALKKLLEKDTFYGILLTFLWKGLLIYMFNNQIELQVNKYWKHLHNRTKILVFPQNLRGSELLWHFTSDLTTLYYLLVLYYWGCTLRIMTHFSLIQSLKVFDFLNSNMSQIKKEQ